MTQSNALPAARQQNGNGRGPANSNAMPWQVQGMTFEERAKAAVGFVWETTGSRAFRNTVMRGLPPRQQNDKAVDFFISGIRSAVRKNPKLVLESRIDTLWQACIEAAERGVRLDNGEGYLVPYKGAVQFQLGWKGAVKNARQAGVIMIDAQPVYANDTIEIRLGTNAGIDHSPAMQGDRGQLLGVYAWVKLAADEPPMIEWAGMDTLKKFMNASQGSNKSESPWQNWFEEMGRAKVLKRLAKRVPAKDEMDLASFLVDADDTVIEGESEVFGIGTNEDAHDPETGEVADDQGGAQIEHQPEQEATPKASTSKPADKAPSAAGNSELEF